MANEFKVKNGIIISGSADIEQNLTVRGTLTADQYNVSIVSTSILYESGSTKFGDTNDDTHQFTGSVKILGSIDVPSITGSLSGSVIGGASDNLRYVGVWTGTTHGYYFVNDVVKHNNSLYVCNNNVFGNGTPDVDASFTLLSDTTPTGSFLTTSSFENFTGSYTTGSFTGSFIGDGSGLYNIPSTGITGLNLSQISSGSVSASISPNNGLVINTNTTITGSLTVSGSFNYVGPQSITGSQQISGSISLYPTNDPDPNGTTTLATHIYVSSSNNQTGQDLYIRQQDNKVKWKWFEGKLNTGILWGGALSYSGSTIYITPGTGIVINQRASATSEISPITNYVSWNAITASCQNLTSSLATYVGIDISGSLYQQDNYFSVNQYRETIPLGMFNHTNKTSITSYANDVLTAYDDVNQTANFIQAFGPMKLEGLTLTPQSGNLQLTIGSGQSYIYGGFYQQDPNNSSHKITAPIITPQIARVRRDGNGSFTVDNNNGAFYTTIDPSKWDDGTGTLNTLSGGAFAIQRVFFNPFTRRVHVYYGQSFYGTKTAAFQSLASDPFVEAQYSAHQYVLVGYIIHKGVTSDLANDENQIVQAGLFRNTVGSGGGTGTFASLHDLDDVDIINPNNGDVLRYNSTTNLWEHSKQLTGDYQITGSLHVSGTTSGSFIGSGAGLYNIPASGVTGLELNKIISGNASASIDNNGFYVNRDFYVDGTITAKEFHTDYYTSSVLFQSGSTKLGDSYLDTHQFTGSVLVNGNINATSITGSINFNNLTDLPTLVSGSSQISYTGLTNIPAGIVSGSEQLTSSYDTRYVLSGSITQTTWDNIANKPSGITSGSSQIVDLGFLETSSFNTYTSSNDGRVSSLESKTGSYATTGSNVFIGTERVTGSLLVSGSVVISGSLDITNANVGSSRFLYTQTTGSTTWNIPHNLGYSYPNVTVYDGSNNKVMLPADVISIDANNTQVTFATPEYGYALVSVGGISTGTADRLLHTQDAPTGSWVIDHNLGYKFPNVDVYDSNDEQLIPQKIKAVSVNRIEIDFISPTSGHAIISMGGQRSTSLFTQNGYYYTTQNNIGITGSLIVSGDVDAANFNSTSDSKLKIDLIKIEGALDKIEKLNGYTFNWLEEYSEDRTRQIGMLADEVYDVQPELISKRTMLLGGKEEEIKLLDYAKVNALLVEGIKELTKRVIKLENKK